MPVTLSSPNNRTQLLLANRTNWPKPIFPMKNASISSGLACLALLFASLPASAESIQSVAGPVLASGGGGGTVIIDPTNDTADWLTANPAGNGLALTDGNATGTYYFGFDWTIDNNTGETGGGGFFGGLWFYQDATERNGFGNGWSPVSYGIAGTGGDALVAPTTPYAVGVKVRIVGKIQFMAGGDEIATMWVNPLGGAAEGAQTGVPVVTTTRNFTTNSVRLRTGNTPGASTLENLMVSTDFESAAAWDFDVDGMPDGWERKYALDPTLDDAGDDADGDGLTNLQEYQAGTNPANDDTDGDGVQDGTELANGTNPVNPDTDGDGLTDAVETNTGTLVDASDTGTNPLNPDTDGDNYNDGLEVRLGSDPHDDQVTPPQGNLDVVGIENYDYASGTTIVGQTGGEWFDYDNSTESDIFTGHTGSTGAWVATSGNPQVVGGKLLTGGFPPRSSGGVLRRFNGPGTGDVFGSDERAGVFSAINIADANRDTLYFTVRMRRSPLTEWSGVSLYNYTAERIFIGVPTETNPTNGRQEFAIDESGTDGIDFSGVAAVPLQDYRLVAKVDLPTGLVSLWVDPDLGAGEGGNIPLVTRTHSSLANLDLTGIRLASNGLTEWDDLVVATTWGGLSTGAADHDGDGLADTWETLHGLSPDDNAGDNGAAGDPDQDNVSNLQEQSRGSDPHDGDTDDDGLSDAVETHTGAWISVSERGTDPSNGDSDYDGLGDAVETNTGLYVDANNTGTDPNRIDTDGDGFADGLEVLYGSNPLDTGSAYGDDRSTVGTDDFGGYADGPLAGLAGGTGFDFDNSYAGDLFTGHTGTTSDWDDQFGVSQIVGGKLRTLESGAKREFNGPGEGSGDASDERAGAVNEGLDAETKLVYLRADLTRGAGTSWSGISGFDFGSERLFVGVVGATNPASGKFEFSIGSPDATVYTGIEPVPGQAYTLVVKIDYAANLLSLWVNPDLTGPEPTSTASKPFTITNWTTAVRLGSGGSDPVDWDHLVVAYNWQALGVFPGNTFPEPTDDYAAWIGGFPSVGDKSGLLDDPDADGQPNGIEHLLGTLPDQLSAGLTEVSATANSATFRHTRTNSLATDITAGYQWSTDLVNWHGSGDTDTGGTTVTIAATTIVDNEAPDTDQVEVTATVTAGPAARLFVRLTASQAPPAM